ncbi:isoform a [Nannochloropsis gaditana]|uniref:Purple acid phosphatase n=1 Tax=Nannochloropsis gaditana TaxID=72520 RepID=W7TFF3_9STRA|nr:isoform a [Nannochloropsis gaditana]
MYSLLLLALSATSSAALHHAPEQIHIAFGKTPDIVAVQWSTRVLERAEGGGPEGQQPRSFVYWGKDPTHLDEAAEGLSISFVDGGARKRQQQHHVVNMTGLEASTRYHYQVGDPAYGGLSRLYSFKTAADAVTLADDLPIRLAIYGDMGVDKNGSTVVRHLLEHMHGDPDYLDGVLHVGDFAYDMDERDGVQGDLFMRQIEPVAARLPYMTSMGNHEKAYNFLHYSERFRNMPVSDGEVASANGPPAPNNWWYSFNIGPVHLVAVSTEIYDFGPYDYIPRQYQWLEKDLKEANANRTLAPWIIVHGHKPLYCSSPTPAQCDNWYRSQREGIPLRPEASTTAEMRGDGIDASRLRGKGRKRKWGLEELFYTYGVDLYFCGHEHNSERLFDVVKGETGRRTRDMQGTTYIVTGAGGNREGVTPFLSQAPARVASRAEVWGYSILEVHNATHVYYEQRACDRGEGREGEGRRSGRREVWRSPKVPPRSMGGAWTEGIGGGKGVPALSVDPGCTERRSLSWFCQRRRACVLASALRSTLPDPYSLLIGAEPRGREPHRQPRCRRLRETNFARNNAFLHSIPPHPPPP